MNNTDTAAPTYADSPAYIARDAYVGKWSIIRKTPKAAAFTAAEIAAIAPTGVIWTSFGHPFPGREGFGRERYIADADGNLHVYNSDGARAIIHPADRRLRILTK